MINSSRYTLVAGISVVSALFMLLALQASRKTPEMHTPQTSFEPTNQVSLSAWEVDYRSRFDRSPPKNVEKWLAFAEESSCPTNLSFYLQIYADLKPWFDQGHIHPDSLIPFQTNQFLTCNFDGHNVGPDWSDFHTDGILGVLEGAKPFTFILNFQGGWYQDDPRSARASDPLDVTPYYSINDVFSRNACFHDKFDTPSPNATLLLNKGQTIREMHGFFQTPTPAESMTAKNIHGPVFSQSKSECFADIMMPQDHHHNVLNDTVVDVVPWEEKENVLFWRGGNTGGRYTQDAPWRKYHRTRLVQWAKEYEVKHPGSTIDVSKGETANGTSLAIDIGFAYFFSADSTVEAAIRSEYGLKGNVNFTQTKNFKYLIVVDGFTWPARLQLYLETNSVILYNGIFTDFFNQQLIPFVHYVPFKLDYSDLEERLEWLQNNEDKAKEIVTNAQALMKIINRKSYYRCYIALLMLEYSRLYGSPSVQ
ncbi:capsule-associated protein CAP1 [Podochytrium sp. JEL0797]|nr:capsule-associated protein CAP1 [Podochytrium sp. JEL0797]